MESMPAVAVARSVMGIAIIFAVRATSCGTGSVALISGLIR